MIETIFFRKSKLEKCKKAKKRNRKNGNRKTLGTKSEKKFAKSSDAESTRASGSAKMARKFRFSRLLVLSVLSAVCAASLPRLGLGAANYTFTHFYTTDQKERERALNKGFRDEGICCYVYSDASQTTPLYRLVSTHTADHFFTTSLSEADAAVAKGDYKTEGVCCFVYQSEISGSVPLYRLRNSINGEHFFTTSRQERDAAIANGGYQDEGICCYVAEGARENTAPLYRSSSAANGSHFYTTNQNEANEAVAKFGYQAEGVCCNVFKSSAVSPLYRLFQPDEGGGHLYTMSVQEREQAFGSGYKPEGICCYASPEPLPGSTVLHRLYNAEIRDHFYTTSQSERTRAITMAGYQDEGSCCNVFQTQQPGTVPLFRLYLSQCVSVPSGYDNFVKAFGYPPHDYCSNPSPPDQRPQISLSVDPESAYIAVGKSATLNWQIARCPADCSITVSGYDNAPGYDHLVLKIPNAKNPGSSKVTPGETFAKYRVQATNSVGTSYLEKTIQLAAVTTNKPCGDCSAYYFKMIKQSGGVAGFTADCFTLGVYLKGPVDAAKRQVESVYEGYSASQIEAGKVDSACPDIIPPPSPSASKP